MTVCIMFTMSRTVTILQSIYTSTCKPQASSDSSSEHKVIDES